MNKKKEILSWLRWILAFVLLVFLFSKLVTNAYIPTSSMENTIMTGDRIFGNKMAYVKKDPKRGDIIFFYYPDDPSKIFVKRIIGLPGDSVSFTAVTDKDGNESLKTVLNGEILDEPYIKEPMEVNDDLDLEFNVPPQCYFVMGDNRNVSDDARYWENTYLERNKIISKAVFRYYPFSKMGRIH